MDHPFDSQFASSAEALLVIGYTFVHDLDAVIMVSAVAARRSTSSSAAAMAVPIKVCGDIVAVSLRKCLHMFCAWVGFEFACVQGSKPRSARVSEVRRILILS